MFGFGLVMYEMLTGRRAFDGESGAAVIAAIMSGETPPLRLSHPSGGDIEWVVRRCLEKNPDDRWQSMDDVHAVLKRIVREGFRRADRRDPLRLAVVAMVAVALALAAAAVWWAARSPADPAPAMLAFSVSPPEGGAFTPTEGSVQTAQFALAPDGRSLAYVAAGTDGIPKVWIRRFDSVLPAALAGTEHAAYPFWSPDSRSIGFFARGLLRRIDVGGGPARTIALAPNGRGGTWGHGEILFAPATVGTIKRVAAEGGSATDATRLEADRGEVSHRWPHFLPDGRRFLFFARSSVEAAEGIYVASLGGGPARLVVESGYDGAFVPPDRVLFIADGTLLSRRFNPVEGGASGDPVPVAESVGGSSNFYGAFSASLNGALAYARGALATELRWIDRAGAPAGVATTGHHIDFRVSPDGRSVAVSEVDPETDWPDIYLLDLARGARRRVTSSRATDASPVWSPDGRQVVFRSNRASVHDLYVKDIAGTDAERRIETSANAKYATSWSPDGRLIAFHTRQDQTRWDVAVAPADLSSPRRFVLSSRFNEMQAQFSPDGRWLAYTSDEASTGPEVYMQSIDGRDLRIRLSVNGGSDPRWRTDGRELFYLSSDGYLMAVPLRGRGDVPEAGQPQRLFAIDDHVVRPPFTSRYDVAPDGTRFLVRRAAENVRSLPITVLLNSQLLTER